MNTSPCEVLARPGAIVNHLYFANSSFLNDGSIIVSSNHDGRLAFYRVSQNHWTQIAALTSAQPAAAPNARVNINFRYSGVIAHALNRFYWVDGNAICSCDAVSGGNQRRVVVKGVSDIGEPLSYYPGGDYIFFFVIANGRTSFGRMNISTESIEWGPRSDFLGNHVQAYDRAGHQFLCAQESTCRDGVWYHNNARVWIGDFTTGQLAPYYRHEDRGNGNFEHIGHEMTDYATGSVIAARYQSSPVGAPGVVRLKQGGSSAELIWAGKAWHPAISADGRRIIVDCQPDRDTGPSPLVLIDVQTQTARVVGESHTHGGHPYHPHPCIDATGSKIAYIERDSQGDGASVKVLAI